LSVGGSSLSETIRTLAHSVAIDQCHVTRYEWLMIKTGGTLARVHRSGNGDAYDVEITDYH